MRLLDRASVVAPALLLLCLAACGGSDEPAAAAAPAATAGPATGTTALRGVVTMKGEPLAGAEVTAIVWPDPDDTPEGGTVDTLEMPPAVTDEDGVYAVRIDPDELSSRYFGGEYLNIDLRFTDEKLFATWGIPVFLVDGRVWRSDQQSRVGDPTTRLDVDLGRKTITETDSLGEKTTSDLPMF